MLLGVEPQFVEALAHTPRDDAEHIRARFCRQVVQLACIRKTLLERLLCDLDVLGQTVLGTIRMRPLANERRCLIESLLRDLSLTLR
jgi:hypothetical protein